MQLRPSASPVILFCWHIFWRTTEYIVAENKHTPFWASWGASSASSHAQVSLADFQGHEFESACVRRRLFAVSPPAKFSHSSRRLFRYSAKSEFIWGAVFTDRVEEVWLDPPATHTHFMSADAQAEPVSPGTHSYSCGAHTNPNTPRRVRRKSKQCTSEEYQSEDA